ncbi:hypothetical protein OWM07_06380 [Deferribacter thermophilus]|uniref:hypothetical protein n=1 Tax=Deferribacter thermophilus TaxID=53573 RepID=UPI003C13353A
MKKVYLLVLFLLFSHISYAHKLNVFAYLEDGKIVISSYFVDGNPCKNCTISIYKDEKVVFQSITDKNGELITENSWGLPLKIVSNESLGHKGEFLLSNEEINDKNISNNQNQKNIDSKKVSFSKGFVEEIVKKEIEKALKPYKIYIGIATLFGLFGILMVFKKR